MLQSSKQTIISAPNDSPAAVLASVVAFLRRRSFVILLIVLLMMGFGVLYLYTTPPRFTAYASLVIDSRKVQLFQQQSVLGDISVDSATVETQIEILRSEKLALSVM